MNTTLAPAEAAVTAPPMDPRLAAFVHPESPEVFHSVATPTALWLPDPFDVDTIHAPARVEFERLLHRGASEPPAGSVLVLLGEAGSGKTHLMRAFRTFAHAEELGYCGYLQMTTEVGNYARYMLANLIDGFERPYSVADPRTSLARLSDELLEMVPRCPAAEREAVRDNGAGAAELVDELADRLLGSERFAGCDLELVRVMLHLRRDDPRVRTRALMWLRCQEMRPQDREWIGGAVPRADESDPLRMIRALAQVSDAVRGKPLVLLVDQLEDMANQSAPVERFRKVVDAVCALTDRIPNTVVVLACLEDYFRTHIAQVTRAKHDRLTRDPEPIPLPSNRTLDEIRAMVSRRMAHLCESAGVPVDAANPLFPFREAHLIPLNGLRTRDALDFLRRHHQRCISEGRWVEPDNVDRTPGVGAIERRVESLTAGELAPLWNDFHSQQQAVVPDEEEQLAGVLATAIRNVSVELPDGFHFGERVADDRHIEVELHRPDDSVEKLLVAVCNANPRGGGLGKQIEWVEKRLGDFPVALVRTTEFPNTKTAQVVKQITKLIGSSGRRVVVTDTDWRRMLAFEAFRKQHSSRPDFALWQRSARPLGELDSLQRILRLDRLAASTPAAVPPPAPPPTSPPAVESPPPVATSTNPTPSGPLVFGRTLGAIPNPVTFEPNEFTQHAAFLGGSGSGKTTAALNLIDQLLARGIPAVFLDRKGDLCRYADPAAWDRPLNDPVRTAARQSLRTRLDVRVYTPGRPNGRPLALPIVPPGFADLSPEDREQCAQFAASAVGSMIGFGKSDADQAQRAILAKGIETLGAVPGSTLTLVTLRELIEEQDPTLLTAIGGAYPDKHFANLGQRLLTLELNAKQLLTGGEQLDVDTLLGTGPHAVPGRVRLSVISTRFLGDAARVDFWVSQLLSAVGRWCARSPRPHLQAVFLFDEADVYLPAGNKQPATKGPMEDLLKRARSAGVGVFLATQSPGDLDYKCKENVRTWLLGRVKEPRALEKLKPMLAGAKGDPTARLAGQAAGEFYLVRESSVVAVRSDESFVRTEQLSEEQILTLARRSTVEG